MTVGAVLGGFERSKSFEGRSRTRSERLWCASWGVLAAKLAVLAAMLAVLDGKLAAQDGPNAVWSRPRALFERMRAIDRRRERSEDDFSSISCCRAKAAMCLAYQFLQCFVGFGRSQHRTRENGQDAAKSVVLASQIRVKSGQDASKIQPRRTQNDHERQQAQQDVQNTSKKRPRAKNSANMAQHGEGTLRIFDPFGLGAPP